MSAFVIGCRKKKELEITHIVKLEKLFPGYKIAQICGFHRSIGSLYSYLSVKQGIKPCLSELFMLTRRIIFIVYLFLSTLWMIMFSTCVFSYELTLFEKGSAAGTEKDGSIIIRLLDNVPWTALMARNIVVVWLFYARFARTIDLTNDLSSLLKAFSQPAESFHRILQWSCKMTYITTILVLVNYALLLLYLFHADLDRLPQLWDSVRFPWTVYGWQEACLMTLFTLPNYIAAQLIIVNITSLVAGGVELMKQLNGSMQELIYDGYSDFSHGDYETRPFSSVIDGTKEYPQSITRLDKMIALRQLHFRIGHYVHAVKTAFSETLMVVVAADFAAALGYIGLLIGEPDSADPISAYFDRIYHGISTLIWMMFYLIAQYWPLIILPEEAHRTHHHVQNLSFHFGAANTRKWGRELMHFLLASKDTHIGIVAGRLLHFSRQFSVTIITLLCSYGVLVYELLHRSQVAHGEAAAIAKFVGVTVDARLRSVEPLPNITYTNSSISAVNTV